MDLALLGTDKVNNNFRRVDPWSDHLKLAADFIADVPLLSPHPPPHPCAAPAICR